MNPAPENGAVTLRRVKWNDGEGWLWLDIGGGACPGAFKDEPWRALPAATFDALVKERDLLKRVLASLPGSPSVVDLADAASFQMRRAEKAERDLAAARREAEAMRGAASALLDELGGGKHANCPFCQAAYTGHESGDHYDGCPVPPLHATIARPADERPKCGTCHGAGVVNDEPIDSYYGPTPTVPCPTCHDVGDVTVVDPSDPGENRNVLCPKCAENDERQLDRDYCDHAPAAPSSDAKEEGEKGVEGALRAYERALKRYYDPPRGTAMGTMEEALSERAALLAAVDEAVRAETTQALLVAARDVCMYCGKRANPHEPGWHEIHGPNEAGNYFHQHPTRRDESVLCAATTIHSRLRYASSIRASRETGETGETGEGR